MRRLGKQYLQGRINMAKSSYKRFTDTFSLVFILAIIATLGPGPGIVSVGADNVPQAIPFGQNWTNTGLITTNDDWSGVPGIRAFQGNDLTTATGADPRTIVADGSSTVLDVIANVANCDTNTSGGIAECEGAGGNPTIALQGSGTADVAHLVIYLNTTGQSNVRLTFNARDIDGSADNTNQQINTQYRVGSTGNFVNLPGGYIADASTGPSQATLVTPVDVTLPAFANNQPLVEIRIMTTNAPGSDEWIGIDDISVTTTSTPLRNRANVDFDGDLRSDYVLTRNQGGSLFWYILQSGTGSVTGYQWGLDTDTEVPSDYDGDGRTDVAVWRPLPGTASSFYILRSSNFTVQIENFGLADDDPSVVGDYDGDGRADVATYRCPIGPAGQCTWFFRGTLNNPSGAITYSPWGNGVAGSPRPAAGDYDGDGKMDLCVFRNDNGQGQFVLRRSSDQAVEWTSWGLPADFVVPGDFDGDGKADFAVARPNGSNFNLYILERDGGGTGASPIVFASPSLDDDAAFGDYDGDGATDVTIWRGNPDPTQNYFWVRLSGSGSVILTEFGQAGDRAVAQWNFPREYN
jgi:hypothetical protein